MRIDRTDKNTNFGFNFSTHREIMKEAINEVPKLKKYTAALTEFVQKPDFDELGFKSNNHFFYMPEQWRPRTSFMDMLGRNNAYSRYNIHVGQMLDNLSNGRFPNAMEEAGRACHFLEDVNGSLHTQRGTILDKAKDFNMHKNYETSVYEIHNKLLQEKTTPQMDFKNVDFEDIFMISVRNSHTHPTPSIKNRVKWGEIAQIEISNAIDATVAFLTKLAEKLK